MIHAFHGFLGSPTDLSFLGEKARLHDLRSISLEALAQELTAGDTLIGYSMGGRVALEIAARKNFQIKQLVLINAHPGLAKEEEIKARIRWEDEILARLQEQSPEDFLTYWNDLPIFAHDKPIKAQNKESFQEAAQLFRRFRLSHQENFLPALQKHRDQVLFLIGKDDEKYLKMANEYLLPAGIKCRMLDGGHRLFQKAPEVLKVLKEEKIL